MGRRGKGAGERVSRTVEEEITELILEALKEFRTHLGKKWTADLSPAMPLYGHSSEMDSLGLVQLLIDVEERVSDRYGVPVSLTDEKAMSQTHSPFRSVNSLAQYLAGLIASQRG